jgi:hypothetical protein
VTLGGVAVLVLVVALTAMWAYALFGRPEVPGRLDDAAFRAAAEQTCARARAALDEVPRSFTARTAAERADLVVRGTDILSTMIDELAAQAPTTEPGRAVVTEWLADWRTYLDDRRDYADRLRTDPDARFYVSQSDRDKRQITAAVDRLANVNQMTSCTVPDDVG